MFSILNEKREIITHHKKFIHFVQGLQHVDERILRQPIRVGKWSTIEIIGHFYPWDEFILQNRLPFLFTESTFSPGPKADDLNSYSAMIAKKNNIHNTLTKCITIRTKLIETLNTIPDEKWSVSFKVNQSPLTLYQYFNGLMEHDIHHLTQIQQFLTTIHKD